MDTFIVRFYRRTRKTVQELAGTVEHVGSGRRNGFAGQQELLERLLDTDPAPNADLPPDADLAGAPEPKSQPEAGPRR
jgi:hypothetical protein